MSIQEPIARRCFTGAWATAIAWVLTCQLPVTAVSAQDTVAYVNATIETVAEAGRLENATLVVTQGKIEAVGQDLDLPVGARVVDLRGHTLIPGVIDPYRVISVGGGPAAAPPRTITINGRTFTIPSRGPTTSGEFTKIIDNLDPDAVSKNPWWRSGVTHQNLVSSSYGIATLVRVTGDESRFVQVPQSVMFARVTNRTSSLDILRNGLKGQATGRALPTQGGQRGRGQGRRGGRGGPVPTQRPATPPSTPTAPVSEINQSWAEVKQGNRSVIINADNSAAIAHLLQALKPYEKVKFGLVASGANLLQAWPTLNHPGAVLILSPVIDTMPFSQDRVNVARRAYEQKKDFVFSFSLSSSQLQANQDHPLYPVAWLVKTGLPRDAALKALTLGPAELLGVAKQQGSLEKGKQANFLVFDGDPLNPSSTLVERYIEGVATKP